jgi:hypothetical protein
LQGKFFLFPEQNQAVILRGQIFSFSRTESGSDSKRANYLFYFKLKQKTDVERAKLFDGKRIQVRGQNFFCISSSRKKLSWRWVKLF